MFDDKKILILGMARSGYEACKYLSKHNNTIILNDGGSRDKQDKDKVLELERLGITMIFDSHPDDFRSLTVWVFNKSKTTFIE